MAFLKYLKHHLPHQFTHHQASPRRLRPDKHHKHSSIRSRSSHNILIDRILHPSSQRDRNSNHEQRSGEKRYESCIVQRHNKHGCYEGDSAEEGHC